MEFYDLRYFFLDKKKLMTFRCSEQMLTMLNEELSKDENFKSRTDFFERCCFEYLAYRGRFSTEKEERKTF